jgi:acetylornithine deacetylase/succinyl-diaminopimelate desuccinylase-like protein
MNIKIGFLGALFGVLLSLSHSFAAEPDFRAMTEDFKKTLKSLVRADTTNPPGNEAKIVQILSARLKAEGVQFQTQEFAPGRKNLVARLKAQKAGGGDQKPLLLIAHIDVVGTEHQNWSVPSHDLTEKDGYLYGRGSFDDLGMATLNLETFLAIKHSGIALSRDLILAYTGDEEAGGRGIKYLLKTHPEWIDAGIALNEGGMPVNQENGGPVRNIDVQMAEKVYQDFIVTTHGVTGHSSIPKKDNAIYRLSQALARLGQYKLKPHLIPITRSYYEKRMSLEPKEVADALQELMKKGDDLSQSSADVLMSDPLRASQLSTTCVATMLSAGTKVNALPAEATAMINCRILPDESIEQTHKKLIEIFADPQVEVKLDEDNAQAGPSPIDGELPQAIVAVAQKIWPDARMLPTMSTGATDSRYLRSHGIDSYGFVALAGTEADLSRMHGIDERIQVSSITPGLEFMYQLLVKLTSKLK